MRKPPKTDKFSCRVARELCIGRIGVVVITSRSSERQFRQFGHDALRFDTHVDDGDQEIEDVARSPLFARPEVGVVVDAAGVVNGPRLAFPHPIYGTFAIHDVVIRLSRDVVNGDVPVVDDGVAFVLFGESHFLHRVVGIFVGSGVVPFVHFHPLCLVGIVLRGHSPHSEGGVAPTGVPPC